MFLRHVFLRHLFTRSTSPSTSTRRPSRVQLSVESLSERCLPSAGLSAPIEGPVTAFEAAHAPSAEAFVASGSLTSVTFHGSQRFGPVEGSATQIGPFTGSLDATVTRLGADETARGTLTLVTTSGDRLVLSFTIVRERDADTFVGSYFVSDGTGRFADASGTGTMTLTPRPDLTASFTLEGSLHR